MPRTKRALADVDPNAQMGSVKKSSKSKAACTSDSIDADAADGRPKNTATKGNSDSNKGTATQLKFVSLCRPVWDIETEKYDKGEDDDEDEDEDDEDPCAADCVCKDPGNERPDWTWVASEEALKLLEELEVQAFNRDQDAHNVYMYNDFSSYGMNEVVDNWLKDFNKEVSRRTVSPYAVWAQLESMSMFLRLDYAGIWFCGDDSPGISQSIALIGKAVLTGLEILKKHQLLKPYEPENGGIKNISVVLAMFVEFVNSWADTGGDLHGETKWVPRLGEFAKDNNIEIKGPYNFQERNQELLQPAPGSPTASDDQPKEKKKKLKFSGGTSGVLSLVDVDSDDDEDEIKVDGDYSVKGWKKAFKEYTAKYAVAGRKTIGGSNYDITKIPKSQIRVAW